jgi:uncharacterized protein (TIGR02444 family)
VTPGLWDWIVEIYSRPGVEPACLTLQDEHGQSTPYLLWTVWAGARGGLARERCLVAVAIARPWERAVTHPLRAARRGLKPAFASIDDPARRALRIRIKADELEAERLLLQALEPLAEPADAPPLAAEAALRLAAEAWGPPPTPALDRLATALTGT